MYMWCTFDHSYAIFPTIGLINPVFIAISGGGDYYAVCLDLVNRGYGQYTLKANGKPDIILGHD